MASVKSKETNTSEKARHKSTNNGNNKSSKNTSQLLKSNAENFKRSAVISYEMEAIKSVEINDTTDKPKSEKKKIQILVDEDDPCLKDGPKDEGKLDFNVLLADPRFQQQNQTLRCWVMYTDFYRCESILGEGSESCTWFKKVFTAICPTDWVTRWDELRVRGVLPWHKHRSQGDFPGDKYGV